MNLFFFSLLFSSLFNLSFARGGFHNVSGVANGSFAASARHLFADNKVLFSEEEHLKRLEELAKDYMSNSDLENAIMSLNRRCSGISRVYRSRNKNKNKGLDLSVGNDLSINRPATRPNIRNLNNLVSELVTMDENTVETKSEVFYRKPKLKSKQK
ncbi:hypothetical protein HAX54_035685 [Datura stramonium]|uniref:Uncharacterized protein n=1 Tax=Datura stramonium TaxID=4076 RepID=A0ABS8SFN3_DATST|nr:hypothetical protein [Datura stramonium]